MTPPKAATLEPPAAESIDAPAARHTHADHTPKLELIALTSIDRRRNHRVPRPGDEQRITALMQSIAAGGQLQPVRVYERQRPFKSSKDYADALYVLGFGWRRCEAMARLGFERVRAEVFPPAPDHEIEAARGIENIHRQDITPIEEAQAVADILKAYATDHPAASHAEAIDYAAAETGRSPSWVRDRDYFHRLAPHVREFAVRVNLPAGHLRELAKVGDHSIQFSIACQAVHTWSSRFKPGTIDPDHAHNKKGNDEFFADASNGVIHIERLDRVKAWVDEAQRSLRSVPWSLTLPVLVKGRGALPACDECRHNTANDLTLFGVDPNDDTRAATCMNPGCFEMKKDAAEAERVKAAASFARLKQQTPKELQAKVEAAPGWLDGKKLKGYIQREAKKAAADPSTPEPGNRTQRNSYGGRKLTAHEQALNKYRKAVDAWVANAADLLSQLIHAELIHTASWRLMSMTEAIDNLDRSDLKIPRPNEYGAPTTAKPTPAEPLPNDVMHILKLTSSKEAGKVIMIAGQPQPQYGGMTGLDGLPNHPEFIEKLAQTFGGDPSVLGAFPSWTDYEPSGSNQSTAKKKTPRKKSSKKKTTKKKGPCTNPVEHAAGGAK